LSGNEELDQARMFQLYSDLKGSRSSYEVAKRFGVKEAFVEGLRVQYRWDEQVNALENEDLMSSMEETSLNEAILLQNDMVLAIKNRVQDSNLARESLQVKGLTSAEVERLEALLLKPNEMIKLTEKVMEIKGQASANIRRRPGKIYVLEDPQRAKELQEKYAAMRRERQKTSLEEEKVEVVT
jgi:hypothetical protein